MKRIMAFILMFTLLSSSCLGLFGCGASEPPFTPSAEVVNKDGVDAVVTYVVDDGYIKTGEFAKKMMQKYSDLTFSFAIRTRDFGTLTETADKSEYVMDGDKYVYTQTDTHLSNIAFWQDVMSVGQSEIIPHTHTHSFWGTNDDGGEFEYVKNNSEVIDTGVMPKGSTTKELFAPLQLINEYFPSSVYPRQNPITIIHAGIGVRTSDYTVGDKKVPTYLTYYNSLVDKAIADNVYIGGRGTFQVTDTAASASKVILPSSLKSAAARRSVPAYMIVNANKGEAGISNWTAFIDHAIEKGGWACYCIHAMSKPEEASGHYIYESDAEALFTYSDDKNVWVATFTDAMLYYLEWSTASVKTEYENGVITVKLNDKEPDQIFNMPLTVKVTVPLTWKAPVSGGQTLDAYSDDNGNKYVLLNIVPGSGPVEITESAQ
ncbi:MAG: hypothetical protein IJV70_06560 [Clostridia bacterium]|nr:hypothetical protein [Clostridia bacterium]